MKIVSEPIMGYSTYTIMVEFRQENLVVHCIECLRKICFVVNNKCIAATNGFKLCSLISDGCLQRSLCLMHNQLVIVSFYDCSIIAY